VGGALWDAQIGLKSPAAKPLKGFGGAGVLEVVVDFDGNAFRTVYTVRFAEVVYVLHAFQKKSRQGIATPRGELDVIRARLARARKDYELWRKSHPSA
jgi:phage-related protein